MDGLLNVYKERGFTSHDVVAKLRGILKQKKIGHTGTLDPEAEGVLPVCLGKATKVCGLLTEKDKEYRAVLLLGITTDTQDTTGKIQKECDVEAEEAAIKEAVMSFVGEYEQLPPMYSALKVGGKKLYELARQGKEVERKKRQVQIHRIVIEKVELPRVTMTVNCSRGTYIRTLCHDIGNRIGCGGCMESLVRISVSDFHIKDAMTLKQIESLRDEGALERFLTPVDTLFLSYPAYRAKETARKRLYNGNPMKLGELAREAGQDIEEKEAGKGKGGDFPEKIRVYDWGGNFIGIYSYEERENFYHPETLFFIL